MLSDHSSYFLPRKAVEALTKGRVDKMRPVLVLEEASSPFSILDCFDQELKKSNRLLLETGAMLELLTPGADRLRQPAERRGDFVVDFQDGAVKQALADVSPLRCLRPIASGRMRKGVLTLLDDQQKTRCRGHLLNLDVEGGGGAAVLTPEGLRGYDTSLARLREHILACGGRVLSPARLWRELLPDFRGYDPKPEVIIAPEESAFDAATTMIAAYLPVLRANEAGIIADHDTEFLHDYRIALRKIRLVLGLFEDVYRTDQTRNLKSRFSALMKLTGRLRDLDVHLLERQRFYNLLPKTLHGGLDKMFEMVTQERRREKAALAHHLASPEYHEEIESLAKLFGRRNRLQPGRNADLGAHRFACRLIWKRYRKVSGMAKRISAETEDAELHLLRIHCKKLRYLMEFFAPLFPRQDFNSLIKSLKSLQDHLGVYNDCSVQQANLNDFLAGRKDPAPGTGLEVAQSVGALTVVLQRQQQEERAKVVECFDRFNGREVRRTFRTLFHGREDAG